MATLRTRVLSFPLLLLGGCVSAPPSQQTRQLQQEVGKLDRELSQLTLQATTLARQSRLNQHSIQGAWLVPAATTPVVLQSQVGELRLWLSNITRQDGGTHALLHLSSAGHTPLAALTGQVEWGSLDDSSGRPLSAESRSETFQVEPTLLPRPDTTVRLHLRGFPPGELGYVRVHGLVLTRSSTSAP